VIDEVVGQYFVSVWFPVTWLYVISGFLLFRFFDIFKPWPIRWVDRKWHHAFATLLDDLMASVLAFVFLYGLSDVLT
jgi:phosphatidylglycerophosphatase A